MNSERKSDSHNMITCEACGTSQVDGKKGTHWICEDCKQNETEHVDNK